MSNYASNKFTKAIVRPPSQNFAEALTEANLGAPDYMKALEQHAAYCAALQECGLELIALMPEEKYPDACFVEDTAIVVNKTVVITRLGHPSRQGEEAAIAKVFSETNDLKYIEQPGTVDGGDIMRVGEHFFIGLSKRTNKEGADQLAKIIADCGKTSSMIPVENYIHLKTFLSPIDENTIAGVTAEIPAAVIDHTSKHVVVPREEHWAANCLSANGIVLIPADCPITEQAIQKLGKEVITLNMSEFQKMDGRLTCLSILF